ncbi:UNKNOWN [Stylonychia lemnae]|uniref:Uncharacterized protein n=1 Tax=Stylonychia lemnae TaxID=5949 RepID=A0A078BD40_STYLE|nr:UNKNOWN [Stylonychia lemnae]|eukprot:CDW91132.1 UNKNOWN [Stylonychia lemnae]
MASIGAAAKGAGNPKLNQFKESLISMIPSIEEVEQATEREQSPMIRMLMGGIDSKEGQISIDNENSINTNSKKNTNNNLLLQSIFDDKKNYLSTENLTGNIGPIDFNNFKDLSQSQYEQVIGKFFEIKVPEDQKNEKVKNLLKVAKYMIYQASDFAWQNIYNFILIDYEKSQHFKIYDEKHDGHGINGSPSKMAQPRQSLNEIIAEKKLKEKRRFIINGPDERNKSVPELFQVVEEAKKLLDDGTMSLKECYEILDSLQETVKSQNKTTQKMMRIAEELLYDAKCQVAIGDEDPRDANPQFSLKAFKQHIRKKEDNGKFNYRSETPSESRANNPQFKISSSNKQKKRIEMGGVKVAHDSNFHEVELLRSQAQQQQSQQKHENSQISINKQSSHGYLSLMPPQMNQDTKNNQTEEQKLQEMMEDYNYQKFKDKFGEGDTHNYFISKENQSVKPSYMFPRKNSYLDFINQTVKKQPSFEKGRNLQFATFQKVEGMNSLTSMRNNTDQISSQKSLLTLKGDKILRKDTMTSQITSPIAKLRPNFNQDFGLIQTKTISPTVNNLRNLTISFGVPTATFQHKRSDSKGTGQSSSAALRTPQNFDAQSAKQKVKQMNEKSRQQSRDYQDVIFNIPIEDKQFQAKSQEQLTEQKYPHTHNDLTGTKTFESIQSRQTHDDNQEVKIIIEKRPSSPSYLPMVEQVEILSESKRRQIVYSSSGQIRGQSDLLLKADRSVIQKFGYQFRFQNERSRKLYGENNAGLAIRTIVPAEMKSSLSLLSLKEKKRPQIIRNASQTSQMHERIKKKIQKPKFYFETHLIQEAQKLEQPHYV